MLRAPEYPNQTNAPGTKAPQPDRHSGHQSTPTALVPGASKHPNQTGTPGAKAPPADRCCGQQGTPSGPAL